MVTLSQPTAAASEQPAALAEVANLKQMHDTGLPLCLPDLQGDPDGLKMPAAAWQRSYVGAPLRHKDQTLGFLNLNTTQPNFYTPHHATLLQAFAD